MNAERQWNPAAGLWSGASKLRPERGERRKAMETTQPGKQWLPQQPETGSAVNAERQGDGLLVEQVFLRAAKGPERGERRKAMETLSPASNVAAATKDRNAVNAERQWRPKQPKRPLPPRGRPERGRTPKGNGDEIRKLVHSVSGR